MIRSVAAELLVARKRASNWVLMGIWVLLGIMFAYITPYLSISGGVQGQPQPPLALLLPERLADNLLGGFPFFGGVIALMLGVLTVGSEYGWDTLKTLLTQRAGRLWMFCAKLAALALALVPFVLAMFAAGAAASYAIARAEGEAVAWPSAWELVRGLAASWVILAAWAALGLLLAVASRGTALAIGIGILYALVIEGLLSSLASQVSWLEGLVEYFLRANASSLVAPSASPPRRGPFVSGGQAIAVLAAYATGFLLLAGLLLGQRDVE
jgi:ABC-2 type transport system permease protein